MFHEVSMSVAVRKSRMNVVSKIMVKTLLHYIYILSHMFLHALCYFNIRKKWVWEIWSTLDSVFQNVVVNYFHIALHK